MLIINFEGREVKGLSKGRYDETFAGEDGVILDRSKASLYEVIMTSLQGAIMWSHEGIRYFLIKH